MTVSFGSPTSRRRGASRPGIRATNTVWLPITAAAGVLLLLLWYAMSQEPGPAKTSATQAALGASGGRAAGAAVASAIPLPTVPPPPESGCVTGKTLPSGIGTRALRVGGTERGYVLAVPTAGPRARPLPLIFNFHDLNQTPEDLEAYTRLADQGTKAGFVVAAPIGTQMRWNFTRSKAVGPDDVLFVGALLNDLVGQMCLDAGRVFAVGYGDGANMVLTLACALPGRLAAAVTVGSSVLPGSCAKPATNVLEIHGTSDQIAPYAGGGAPRPVPFTGVVAQPVEDRLARYASALGCGGARQTSRDTAAWQRTVWSGCPAGHDVGLLAMQGAGHTWPGAQARPALGPTSVSLSATIVALTYFGYTPTPATSGLPAPAVSAGPAGPGVATSPTPAAPSAESSGPAASSGPATTPASPAAPDAAPRAEPSGQPAAGATPSSSPGRG
ncbi:poly(3-hydroxybutyrate) depolymerase [Frankia casuarinae]|uniref:alpha/beta hydrolase family esterase n=1 Tax=Frankia casuarinae (strain DSM 45818 / CECT 9043 / HFP020203 / CcI3) TaxID=106370 RepID=UPI0002EF234F|nr:PHB depolymerase family esterase [Frankia casuarinae]EYT93518.1 poly(3-hydroxybutyrate) depolymerase [Frankia casuarinae]KEZ35683.1 poly(3-hydroxybutyrate) depolymerase [Frankia sp. CeD]